MSLSLKIDKFAAWIPVVKRQNDEKIEKLKNNNEY